MKILIITMNVGRTSPGIVFQRLINGLSEFHEIDLLTADYDPSIKLERVSKVIVFNYKEMNRFIIKMFISIFAMNPIDIYFAQKVISKCSNKYDLILSFISFNHYLPLIAGNKLAKKLKLKHLDRKSTRLNSSHLGISYA